MRGQRAVVGVDLGTSGVKVLVAGLADPPGSGGTVLGRGRAEYPVLVPSAGRAESDPADWWHATGRAVREAVAQARDAEIVAVAVAGQMHGVVLTAADGDAVRSAILWLDQRAAVEAGRYTELPATLTRGLGNRPSAGMAGPILTWLVEHEPENVAAARWALQPKDWVRLRMTGRAATDPTDASGTLEFDLERDAWADDLIGALGLRRDLLPPVRGSSEAAGALLPGPAAELGLPPGITVATGAADTAAALHAVGLQHDEAMLILGSGGQWAVTESELRPTADTNLYRAVGDGYYRLAPVQNVGVTLNWVRTLLDVSWADLYESAARPARPGAPVFVPYLTPERWDPTATGAWTGLVLAHQREDLLRAALDGVAGLLRQRLDDLRAAGHHPRGVILGGGGGAHPA
jgi:xylulokinase